MKLRDLKTVDNVCIYTGDGEPEYMELYRGSFEKVPEELLDKEIVIIGAAKKRLLDIRCRNGTSLIGYTMFLRKMQQSLIQTRISEGVSGVEMIVM